MADMDVVDRISGLMGGRARVRSLVNKLGYDTTDWVRTVMYRECFSFIESLSPHKLDTLEIAAGPQWKRRFQFKSYTAADYPEFDICEGRLDRTFDLIIADQVFEHLKWPQRAGKNVFSMLKPGGTFIVTTPFLIRLHDSPDRLLALDRDGYVLSPAGMRVRGAEHQDRRLGQPWPACAPTSAGGRDTAGTSRSITSGNFPVTVWAFARR